MDENFKYNDIINMQRPVHDGDEFSIKHPPMSRGDRAKIFSPFAALKGFEESIDSKMQSHITKVMEETNVR